MNSAKIIHKITNLLPSSSIPILSSLLSRLAYSLHEKSHHRQEIHNAIASALHLPLDNPQVDKLVKANFKHLLQTIFEIARFDQLKKEWSNLIKIEGIEHYQKIHKSGQGIILLSAHIGNWELLISGLPLLGIKKPYALTWKQPESDLNNLLNHQRTLWGTRILWTQELDREKIKEILTNNGTLLIFADHYQLGKTTVNFFGHPTRIPAGPVLFARKYNAALLPIHTYRKGNRHHIIIEPALTLKSSTEDLTPDLQKCINFIERWILKNPEQWMWIFKRGEWCLE
ncbi:hypothetical protein BBF96_07475 [Anoxybacter fermentans]|uniref:Lipid A biosynthesis acyltransferase n=1 Tax=Anoxybacter fermentans TaxID=1323375 RepID=A0A3Q9HQC4_9FIRM|nr:lysophospholipid acyltransferase family protein [Anoxybacter fermentans]AZR73238.1 hypothetical protein BBF96_07475 [Anoxybacter fermentans]